MCRVTVHLTIDGQNETIIEGEASAFEVYWTPRDELEERNIGFWLEKWNYAGRSRRHRESRVFCPWTSVLMVKVREATE